MRGVWLFLKARSALWLPVLCIAALGLSLLLPGSLTNVPLRSDVRANPQLILGVFPAGMAYLAMRPPSATVERNPPVVRALRCVWWPTIALMLAVAASITVLDEAGTASAALTRNTIIMVAVGTLSATVAGYEFGWTFPLALLGVTLVFGTSSYNGTPQPWSMLNQSPSSGVSWLVALLLAVVAWATYATRDISERPISLPRFLRPNG